MLDKEVEAEREFDGVEELFTTVGERGLQVTDITIVQNDELEEVRLEIAEASETEKRIEEGEERQTSEQLRESQEMEGQFESLRERLDLPPRGELNSPPPVPELSPEEEEELGESRRRIYHQLKSSDTQPTRIRTLIYNTTLERRELRILLNGYFGYNIDPDKRHGTVVPTLSLLEDTLGEIKRRGTGDNQILEWVGEQSEQENARKAKDQLQEEIRARYGDVRAPPENPHASAWVVDIGGTPTTLWPHYSKEWVHWGITKSVADDLEKGNRPLWHVFFGDDDRKRIFIPHEVFIEDFEKDYDPNEGRWKVYDYNNSELLKQHRGYEVLEKQLKE